MLDITEVRFKKIGKGNFLGFAGVCISNSIAIKDIKLFDGKKGKYINMPSIKGNERVKVRQFAFPITEEARKQLLDAIVKKYEEELEKEKTENKEKEEMED